MLARSTPSFLLASPDSAILAKLEPLLAAQGGQVSIAQTADAALALLTTPVDFGLLLLDTALPGMPCGELLPAMQSAANPKPLPVVLISDIVSQESLNLLAEGVIADIVPRYTERAFWQVRIESALRGRRTACELDLLRESAALNSQYDRLTGLYNRDTLLSMLFRETDRVQRMKSSLCMVLFDLDNFGESNARLGAEACDGLLCEVAARTARLLRSYDLLGRIGEDEFLVGMPGCSGVNAVMLAERLRVEVFGAPFQAAGQAVRLTACFGISSSNGRSPLVVLREAEQALDWSRGTGPESIQCFGDCPQPTPVPMAPYSPVTGDRMLAW
jgi:two-component system, cell cycle response regulator